ncbi:DNA polymerase III subunit delta' [Salisediminibacterium halotolerans]|uniref:DNA polymerase-3 subunit delta n=1 Tax=Salisediminibacterium halotolerans TaxID=517425 RepID=A0A1H9VQZ3_9BACI|nr:MULTISPECIES: DNA polymerase III subunit delta' [Salisediminibacterium]RLJ80970.1 DNA polymerase III delta prime subunit [Actinophytocola xinjiangensis]RPE83625.1 DNA polymerase III delta prime subunit [Salisediminibacterium halotolerans]TWG37895.1 DNA polymerase III delta prime subunit [Salisediminibacterium halotolerans]SES24009.1 DNA polymerase-3 subunit delta' [Salisediminibacterium haloalkalitolerans]GEL07027.1 DNA polymerase III subunit delta' [Salisediminibacterium halotolerans]
MNAWKDWEETQPTAVNVLRSSIEKDRLAHAYVFEGGRGTGKKEIAALLAKAFYCKERTGAEPCHHCNECRRIDSGNHPDVHTIEADGASIKVEQIRGLKKEFSMRGLESERKVYLVYEAEKMTAPAANSLLKFLEEPEAEALAVLMTTQVQQLLKTVLSRAQVLSFKPLPPDALIRTLMEHGIKQNDAALVSKITSNVDEALTLCEGDYIAEARSKVIQLMNDLSERPKYTLITIQDDWLSFFKEKTDVQLGIDLLMLWYRDVIRMQVDQTDRIVYIGCEEQLEADALKLNLEQLGKHLNATMDAKRRIDANTSPQLVMEQLLIRLQEG